MATNINSEPQSNHHFSSVRPIPTRTSNSIEREARSAQNAAGEKKSIITDGLSRVNHDADESEVLSRVVVFYCVLASLGRPRLLVLELVRLKFTVPRLFFLYRVFRLTDWSVSSVNVGVSPPHPFSPSPLFHVPFSVFQVLNFSLLLIFAHPLPEQPINSTDVMNCPGWTRIDQLLPGFAACFASFPFTARY